MAVRIRLARFGAKKKPFYRVVVAESFFPRDGRFLDVVGTYDPRDKEKGLNLNLESIHQWVNRGAELTDTVRRIVKKAETSVRAEQ
ncbi:30S ribosomal protein S16 [Desulfomonile tiedjei]|uniref:Small ribosomal subunit protein bS16 n=1 Tax=Desulfomonile tiedjei (strain ATCC 49306 / DSM 6799 / DCB-1) TaxID=706587 RepID=I4C0L3_DESTA|nr:30S ribosomal protein S16 [Desulfomonile tiedjei]AFM23104.1 SSU ribosomal protein S16P [Desulfomonile tiedjei DSM 6799]